MDRWLELRHRVIASGEVLSLYEDQTALTIPHARSAVNLEVKPLGISDKIPLGVHPEFRSS